jgi:hypothetical protein
MSEWKQFLVEQLHTHAHAIPFMLATRRATDGIALPAKLNLTRVLEALIIAGVTGAISMYGMQLKQESQMSEIKYEIAQLQVRFAESRAETNAVLNKHEDRLDALSSRKP